MSIIAPPRDTNDFGKEWISYFNAISQRLDKITLDDLLRAPVFTDSSRSSALTANDAGVVIFNSDDGKLNVWNGSNWTLPDGSIT